MTQVIRTQNQRFSELGETGKTKMVVDGHDFGIIGTDNEDCRRVLREFEAKHPEIDLDNPKSEHKETYRKFLADKNRLHQDS